MLLFEPGDLSLIPREGNSSGWGGVGGVEEEEESEETSVEKLPETRSQQSAEWLLTSKGLRVVCAFLRNAIMTPD